MSPRTATPQQGEQIGLRIGKLVRRITGPNREDAASFLVGCALTLLRDQGLTIDETREFLDLCVDADATQWECIEPTPEVWHNPNGCA